MIMNRQFENVKILTLLQKSLGQLQCLEPETATVDKGSSASNAPGALAGSSCTDQDDDGVGIVYFISQ